MFKRKNKKGFTIVELVIVIAVIGILAAILIPTFVSLNNKANEASDFSLVHNLNTALRMEEAQEGKNKTLNDAVEDLDDYGYKLANLVSKSGENLLWDQEKDEFVINKGEEKYNDYKFWEIRSNMPTGNSNKRSIYAGNGWTTENVDITNGSGFDAGAHNVSSISYSRAYGATDGAAAHDVVIRTNGGTLTVNAPSDDIHHYGYAEKVDVVDVKATSYHENGDVDLIKVKKGHIELEKDAQVLGVYVYNDSTETQKDTSFEEIKITVKSGAEVPQLSRSAVEINATTGTKVCTVVTDEAKDIYLFQQGVYEQIKTVDAGKDVTSDASSAWADDASKNNDKTQKAAQQLANEINSSFTVGETTYNVTVNTESENRELVVTNATTSETVTDTVIIAEAVDQNGSNEDDAVADLPLRGDGLSWETAFEIYDYATMQKISEYLKLGAYYYKVNLDKCETVDGKKVIDCGNAWKSVSLYGNFDGSGVTFINMNRPLFLEAYGIGTNFELPTYDAVTIVKNFTVYNCDIRYDNSYYVGAVVYWACDSIEFENIEISGYLSANGVGSFLGQSNGYDWYANDGDSGNVPVSITFRDCHSSMELVSGAQTGGFIGNVCWSANAESYLNSSVNIIDSYFNGSMTHGSSYHSAYVHAHSIYTETFVNFVYSTGKPNYSYLYYNVPNGSSVNYLYAWVYNGATESVETVSIEKPSSGNYISGTALDNASTIKVYLCIGTNPGNATYNYIVETIDVSTNKNFTTSQIKNFETIHLINGGHFGTYALEGNTLTIDSGNRTNLAGASVRIDQFDSNGKLIAVSNISLK